MPPDELELRVAIPAAGLTVTAAPATHVSQRTSEAVLGIPRRAFLDLARAYRAAGGAVAVAGKLRVVEREAFTRWLFARAVPVPADAPNPEPADPVAARAARLGISLVGGDKRR